MQKKLKLSRNKEKNFRCNCIGNPPNRNYKIN